MGKVNLKAYDNTWYSPGASSVKQTLWFVINALFFINPLNPFSSIKVHILKMFGARIGTGVLIKPAVNIKYPWLLEIGNWCWIGENVWIDNLVRVSIGDNCCLSQGAMLLTGNHNYKKSTFDLMVGEIILESGVWIGARSVVAPGVCCKTHAVLTANSFATSDLESFTIYQGTPAMAVKNRMVVEDPSETHA